VTVIDRIRRNQLAKAYLLVGPTVLFQFIFFALPFVIVLVYSFTPTPPRQPLVLEFTLENYFEAFSAERLGHLLRSFGLAGASTILCLLLAYPMSYYIAHKAGDKKNLILLLTILPFWTSFLIRTYAMISLLSTNGFINQTLLFLGVVKEPLSLLFDWPAVVYGMVYNYLPLMILPLYASVEKLDLAMLEASQSLGAGKVRTFLHVILPLTLPGIAAGSILVFIPAVGEFIIPELLGGVNQYMIGNFIWRLFLSRAFYSQGSAVSIALIAIVLAIMFVYLKTIAKEVKFSL